MISIVTFRWKPHPQYRSRFGPETVNTLFAMLRRRYAQPFRAICVTDDAAGIDSSIETIPLWNDYAELPSPHGATRPSCYRRLKVFDPGIAKLFGPRFAVLDLDCVIVGDVTPLFERAEDFLMWGETHPKTYYNGSFLLMNAGARPQVWTQFHPVTSPYRAKRAGHYGSDQGWISYCLGPNEARVTTRDGVYSYRIHVERAPQTVPANARVIYFNGKDKPWSPHIKDLPWVRESYRGESVAA